MRQKMRGRKGLAHKSVKKLRRKDIKIYVVNFTYTLRRNFWALLVLKKLRRKGLT